MLRKKKRLGKVVQQVFLIKKIQPIGRFFPQDKNGFILKDAAIEKISPHWLPVIQKIKNSYLENLGKKVHSIYLRGSVPRGLAVDGFSDIDVFALIYDFEHRWKTAFWQSGLEKKIQSEFDFVKKIEVMMSGYQQDFFEKNERLAMVLKTQSVCIFGNDLSEEIPFFLPNKKMILNLTNLNKDVLAFLQKEKLTKSECSEMMKIILRSGFELVMKKVGKFTPDLYLCYQTYSNFFPKKEKEMREVLQLYLNPTDDVDFIKKEVKRLVERLFESFFPDRRTTL